jgi:ADP-L-glycero-D-manno-heptose 6-epimerase
MIVVTGGAGFIGSNLVKALCARGERDVLVVDDLEDGRKFKNLVDADILDYLDMAVFLERLESGQQSLRKISSVFHLGACSDTTEWNGRYMMRNNYEYSKQLLHYCTDAQIAFIYASSAAVYGAGQEFCERAECERPINVYGYSKALFDQYARRYMNDNRTQITGLRYFNVYGPGEDHKGRMASMAFHLHHQLTAGNPMKLFEGCVGYTDGEQLRDFIYVQDAVAVNLWFYEHPECSGVFNVGTGNCQSFNNVAQAVAAWHGHGDIDYVPFPDDLKGRYQSFTEADLTLLRRTGCDVVFRNVEQGVREYLDRLEAKDGSNR